MFHGIMNNPVLCHAGAKCMITFLIRKYAIITFTYMKRIKILNNLWR